MKFNRHFRNFKKAIPIMMIGMIGVFLVVNIASGAKGSIYWGEWTTKKETKPAIKMLIDGKKQVKVNIYGKDEIMDFNVYGKGDMTLFIFSQVKETENREIWKNLYVVGGYIEEKAVLTGFYRVLEMNDEGVIKKEISLPIVLYEP